jgi:hypothetical protein
MPVCHTATKYFVFYKSRSIINTFTTAYHWTSTQPEVSKSQTTIPNLILSSHLSLSPLMFPFFQFLNQNLLIFLYCTGWWQESSIRWSIGLLVFIQDILLCSTVRVQREEVELQCVQSFIVHVNTATCFGYTNLAFIRLDIRIWIENDKNGLYGTFHCIAFLKPSYSNCYIQSDDGHVCIAETCSWFYIMIKLCVDCNNTLTVCTVHCVDSYTV